MLTALTMSSVTRSLHTRLRSSLLCQVSTGEGGAIQTLGRSDNSRPLIPQPAKLDLVRQKINKNH